MPGTSAPILQFTSFGRTWYRGLNVSLRSRLNQRLETSATYTLSHAKDTSTDYQSAFLPQNNGRGRDPSNPEGLPLLFDSLAEKGFSIQDQRHRAVLSGSYQAPWNTMIVGLLNAGSGRPYSIIAGVDLNGDGNGGAFPSDRARRVPALESTSVPRNSGRLPPMVTLDLRLSRQYTFENGVRIRGMLEVFNVLNRTNYTEINNVFGSGAYPDRPLPGYGRYTQAGPMRQAQIAVKLLY
jgi:hypothetical protein